MKSIYLLNILGVHHLITNCMYLQRRLLWDLRNEMIMPFGETAQQVFARISATRDALDGPPVSQMMGPVVLWLVYRYENEKWLQVLYPAAWGRVRVLSTTC